jgi:hypothetical protein
VSDKLVLDGGKSRVRMRTFAEGLFARLAHDLELVCRDVRGTAERSDAPSTKAPGAPGSGSVSLEVPIFQIDVNGTLKDDRVDPNGLSASDREDCLGKMRKDVFHTQNKDAVVRVEAMIENGQARARVIPPNGKTVERSVSVRITTTSEDDASVRASGTLTLSLAAIGSDTVKGPMNAFRVKDNVEVLYDLVFRPPGDADDAALVTKPE